MSGIGLFWILLVVSISICVIVAESDDIGSSNEAALLWKELEENLSSHQTLNIERASEIIFLLGQENSDYLDLFVKGKPLLHQLMNLYWLAGKDLRIKNNLVDLLLSAIHHGSYVDFQVKGEPDLLTKAFMTRELRVAAEIIDRTELSISSDAGRMWELFSLNCNPTPLTKLLLHVHTTVHSMKLVDGAEINKKLRSLLLSAYLEGQSPTVRIRDLEEISTHYNTLIDKLSSLEGRSGEGDVYLQEITDSLADVINVVLKSILFQQNLLAISSQQSNMKQAAQAMNTIISHERNPLHVLAMSGAIPTINELFSYFKSELGKQANSEVITLLRSAMLQLDNRGFSPLMYSLYRYGNSDSYKLFSEFALFIGVHASYIQQIEKCRDSKIFGQCGGIAEMSVDGSVQNVDSKEISIRTNVHGDDGGWDLKKLALSDDSSDENNILEDAHCDIMEIWDDQLPSAEEFFNKYLKLGKPIAFRGAAAKLNIRKAFRKATFVKNYGSDRAITSIIPYASSFGIGHTITTLGDVADFNEVVHSRGISVAGNTESIDSAGNQTAPEYVFTVAANQLQKKLQRDAPVPSCLNFHVEGGNSIVSHDNTNDDGSVALQFYLGPIGSGAPAHYHGHAVNTLAYGMKKWYLYPPSQSFYSKIPALDFLIHDDRSQQAMTCTQYGGDIFFVPTLWGHATLNLRQSIGVAHEFSIEPFCME